jgi:hypothetical protein
MLMVDLGEMAGKDRNDTFIVHRAHMGTSLPRPRSVTFASENRQNSVEKKSNS